MKKVLLCIVLPIVLSISFFVVWYLVLSTAQTTNNKNQFLYESNGFIKGVNDCGPQTLQVVCEILGVKSTIEELAQLAGTDESGTTMGGLYQAAEKMGLAPFGKKFTVQELDVLDYPVIAFVKTNHFVVIESFADGKLRILDPPRVPYETPQREFADMWDGHALVFRPDHESVPLSSEPSVVFDKAYYNFGRKPNNYQISCTFTFRNRGLKPLEVSIESSSCQCTAALTSEKPVTSGRMGEVKITYTPKNGNSEEVVKETVKLRTNDPRIPRVVLTIAGVIYPILKLIPPVLNFRELTIGNVADRKLTVVSSNARILRAEASSPDIVAKILPKDEGSKTYIVVSVKPSVVPNPSAPRLFIYTDDANSPRIDVPITYEIAAPVIASPSRVFFGVIKAAIGGVQNVNISKGDMAESLNIERIENASPFISCKLSAVKPKSIYNLQISIDAEAPAGAIRDIVSVYTDQTKVSIPVYGVVTK